MFSRAASWWNGRFAGVGGHRARSARSTDVSFTPKFCPSGATNWGTKELNALGVIRGGAFGLQDHDRLLSSCSRNRVPTESVDGLGFRVVVEGSPTAR